MLRNYWLRLIASQKRKFQEQKGQSIIIMAFAFLGLIAMLGLALDLGLVYIERVRVSRTTDAATLAAVVELPFEEETMNRAIEYIRLNGYNVDAATGDTEIRVRGCLKTPGGTRANVGEGSGASGYAVTDAVKVQPTDPITGYVLIPAAKQPPQAIFVVDTMAYQPVDRNQSTHLVTTKNQETCGSLLYGTATKVRVSGQVDVNMNFMQFFGFGKVPVSDQATAENITNLDVMVVFDVSGSMQFETNCIGCWNRNSTDIIAHPYPSNGNFNPAPLISWQSNANFTANSTLCSANPKAITDTGTSTYYMWHEAEYYSRDVPINAWEFEKRNAGQGFWVMQRTGEGSNDAFIRAHPFPTYGQSNAANAPRLEGGSYDAQCFTGANLSGECWKTRADTLGEPAPSNVPWVEYDFTPS
jgi:Flp pilus assembly protein TadG